MSHEKIKRIFIVPKKLGKNLVVSQMMPIIENLNKLNSYSTLAIHTEDQEKYQEYNNKIIYTDVKELISENTVFYIRSLKDFLKLYIQKKILNKKFELLYDFRGLASDESYLRDNSKLRRFILEQIEKFIYKKADYIHTVSDYFKNYLIKEYGKRKITVIPCCINKNKKKEFDNNSNSTKFVYVGGIFNWQKFDVILKTYKEISKNIENTSLTIITVHQEEAKVIIQKENISNYTIKSLSHNEVIDDLINYDFGFLLRDDLPLNNVASPIKFVEYISQGVIPIISEGIGDYSELVVNEDIGIVVNIDNIKLNFNDFRKLLSDGSIYERLYNISNNYLWENNIKNNFFKE